MPRKKRQPTTQEILDLIPTMPKRDRNRFLMQILRTEGKPDQRVARYINHDLQDHLRSAGFGKVCPKCGSVIITKNGERPNGVQRLKCTDCGHRFTYFSGTFMERTKFSWDAWIEVVYQMLSGTSLKDTVRILIDEDLCAGITETTVFGWRMKILEAAKAVPQPDLVGVVEADEKFIHEGQKGSLKLVDPFEKSGTRKARKTGSPSRYGSLGPEFGTVLCAVDHQGHVVAGYAGVGAASAAAFEKLIGPHLKDMTILCTDANGIYGSYCEKYGVMHYVRPSNYLKTLTDGLNAGKREDAMYRNEMLDYIDGRRSIPYSEFKLLKDQHDLGLGRVNQFHSRLKFELVQKTKGISLKNIDAYVAWQALLVNYSVDEGRKPATRKDAEKILIMLLRTGVNLKLKEISEKEPDFSNLTPHYVQALKEHTDELNKTREYKSARYYITNEDFGPNTDKRAYLDHLPVYMLKFLAEQCGLNGRSKIHKGNTYQARRQLERNPYLPYAIDALIAKYGMKNES